LRSGLGPRLGPRQGLGFMTIVQIPLLPLNQGLYALVDAEDWPKVSRFNWRARKIGRNYYAQAPDYTGGKRRDLLLHRVIMNLPDAIDHRNGDGLDNRRCNLRPADRTQNLGNQRISVRNKSGFKGVGWHQRDRKWRAYLVVNKRQQHLGYFNSPAEAAKAYDRAARQHFRDFACLNFPESCERQA